MTQQQRLQKAVNDTHTRETHYVQQIIQSVTNTKYYDEAQKFNNTQGFYPIVQVLPLDVCAALGSHYLDNKKVCVLNFASYKHPGGGYIRGQMAQEEALCHSSVLFSVLSRFTHTYYDNNNKNLNRGLYTNKALYSPNVLFDVLTEEGSGRLIQRYVDVLTCAAPNWSAAKRNGVSVGENNAVCKNRLEFIINILNEQKVDIAILGAWGCGVFKQDAYEIAKDFKELFNAGKSCIKEAIFVIPNVASTNYIAFYNTFCK